ncbi:MAG: hypothetical protein AB7H97_19815, partial [Pseudobdellovibrionaceae bacterium]
MTTRYSIFLIFAVTFIACSKSRENSTPGVFKKEDVAELSAEFCGETQELYEDVDGMDQPFEKLCEDAVVFGFQNGKKKCAIMADIKDSWPTPELETHTFEVDIKNECLENKSFWPAVSCKNDGDKHVILLHDITLDNDEVVTMTASKKANGNYARDHVGMRKFKCRP